MDLTDYGNAETNNRDDGPGTMEALYWGTSNGGLFPHHQGTGKGPWVMADLENGLFGGNETINKNNTPINASFVVAMFNGREHTYALKGADAQKGTLNTLFDGPRSTPILTLTLIVSALNTLFDGLRSRGYDPARKQGAIILGIGGDNSNHAVGMFLEGVMTSGVAPEADVAVHANIIAAGYQNLEL